MYKIQRTTPQLLLRKKYPQNAGNTVFKCYVLQKEIGNRVFKCYVFPKKVRPTYLQYILDLPESLHNGNI